MNPFVISKNIVQPGTLQRIEIPIARLPTQVMVDLPVVVFHGVKPGPRLWLSGAIHGDEVNGVRIIQEIIEGINPQELHGTLVAIPIVNVFGFLNQSRYFPDRRDLNRCFPGSLKGSLASRLAHQFMTEIISQCTHGIDFHTGSHGRTNMPQIRIDFSHKAAMEMAKSFRAPVVLHSEFKKGSLRWAMAQTEKPYILFEAGEANRFDEISIQSGVEGTFRVMKHLKMLKNYTPTTKSHPSILSEDSRWHRASKSGILHLYKKVGERVKYGEKVAEISNIYGNKKVYIKSHTEGIIIGLNLNSIVHQGDAVAHIATTRRLKL